MSLFKDKYGNKRFPRPKDVSTAWDVGYANGYEDMASSLGLNIHLYESGQRTQEEFMRAIKGLCPEDYDSEGNYLWQEIVDE